MSVTMAEIARQSGVSVATVSRLLRGDPTLRISEQRRQQILRVDAELGGATGRLRNRKLTHAIAVPVSSIFSPVALKSILVESELFQCFEKKMRAHGFRLHFSFFEHGDEMSAFKAMKRSPQAFDGTLVLSGVASQEVADLLTKYRFPHVAFDYNAERFQLNTVRASSAEGMRRAVDHLCELGHRRIGFFGHRRSFRYSLLVAELAARQLPIDDALNCWISAPGEPSMENWQRVAREPFRQWMTGQPRATAMICVIDAVAMAAVDVMNDLGLSPGRDLSLVGHDNLEVRGNMSTKEAMLTTVDNPTDRIGHRGAELLLNQILYRQIQIVHERIPAKLIVRNSTGPCLQ